MKKLCIMENNNKRPPSWWQKIKEAVRWYLSCFNKEDVECVKWVLKTFFIVVLAAPVIAIISKLLTSIISLVFVLFPAWMY